MGLRVASRALSAGAPAGGVRRPLLLLSVLVTAIPGVAAQAQQECGPGETPVEFPVGTITEYVVPTGVGSLRILARGGSGGAVFGGGNGGPGAVLAGSVAVGEGEVLQVLVATVGQEGPGGVPGGGGGGGSFVGVGTDLDAFSASNLLVVAGGGGGGFGGDGGAGGAPDGGDGAGEGGGGGGDADGTGGAPGDVQAGEGGGAATGDDGADGTGFRGAGGGGAGGNGGNSGANATGGQAAVNGGAGGSGVADGGFGGGGAHTSGGGGGGGYAGGGGGSNVGGGGGGSSFFADQVTDRSTEATHVGDGQVLFCQIPASEADLAIAIEATVLSNPTVELALAASNGGPDDATGVLVTVEPPECTQFVSDTCSGNAGPPWAWGIGDLVADGSAACTITLDVSSCEGSQTVLATIEGDQADAVPANNIAEASFDIAEPVPALPLLAAVLLALLLAVAATRTLRRPRSTPSGPR